MKNDVIIDLDNYKVLDDEKLIIVDSMIADTLLILNKKGYQTAYSCSGHIEVPRKELHKHCDLDFLEEAKNDNLFDIEEVREDSFDYWVEHNVTGIYVKFKKVYEFSDLPDGFELDEDTISYEIQLFENGQRRKPSEVEKELNKYNEILKRWAEKLPNIEKRKDDKI